MEATSILNKKLIDLHVHTTYSDGSLTPRQVINLAKKVGVVAVGITDHDITDGIEEAVKEGAKVGIEVIPGVELSSEFKDSAEEEIHILGYYIDWEDKTLQQKLKIFRQARERRAYYIFQKLYDSGIKIKEEVHQPSAAKSPGCSP
jgi:predicted metal-dependent phosphoesterase TrpH